jgi:hypothetical protein
MMAEGTLDNFARNAPILAANSRIDHLCHILARQDHVFLSGEETQCLLAQVTDEPLSDLEEFQQSWERLDFDEFMADGGQYRKRRHSTLSALASSQIFKVEPHQPHYQSLTYNSLNGGLARHYSPIEGPILNGATMTSLIRLGCSLFGRLTPYYAWHIEIHQFRIEARCGDIGKPTPEGVHRDGVNFVIFVMVKRHNFASGSTTIYDLEQLRLDEFTLSQPLDLAIVNDEHCFHGVTPIVQIDPDTVATRDVLVITFRRKL